MKSILYSSLTFPLLLSSCSSFLHEFSDPAVRLATCINTAANSLFYSDNKNKFEVECNTKLSGDYIIIVHPAKDYSNDELIEKGLSVDTIRKLRLRGSPKSPHGIVNVIPLFTTNAGSKSTAYGKHVTITKWLQTKKDTNIVHVELTKLGTNSIAITNIR